MTSMAEHLFTERELRVLNALARHDADMARINRTVFVDYRGIEDHGLQAKLRREDDRCRMAAVAVANGDRDLILRDAYPVAVQS